MNYKGGEALNGTHMEVFNFVTRFVFYALKITGGVVGHWKIIN